MSEDTKTELYEEVAESEQMYTFFPFIKVENDGSILVDGEPGDQDIISQMNIESAKVLVLPCTKMVDQLDTLNESQEQYQEYIEEITDSAVDDTVLATSESEISESMHNDHNYDESLKNSDDNCYGYIVEPPKNTCDVCHKTFNTPATLKRHVRTHTGERPFQCQICDKFFSQQSNLWKHVRTHTGERPFECPNCQKKFSQRANMKKHMIIHTGERPFVCYFCYRAFTQQANLSKHMRLHTGEKPYVCSYCDKRFTQRSNLQKHEHLHEGIKPYTCEICFQAFTQQSNLKKHIMMHKNLRKYSCDICSKSYIQKVSLMKHMQRCTGETLIDDDVTYITHISEEDYVGNSDELITRYEELEEKCIDEQDDMEENSESSFEQPLDPNMQYIDISQAQVLATQGDDVFESQIIEIQISDDNEFNSQEIIHLVEEVEDAEEETEIQFEENDE